MSDLNIIQASEWRFDPSGVQRTSRIVITEGSIGSSKYAVSWQGKEGDLFFGTYTNDEMKAYNAFNQKLDDLKCGTEVLE